MLVDSHTHLDQYPPHELEAVVARALETGVGAIIVAGTTLDSSLQCVALAQENAALFAGVGIHPLEVQVPVDEEIYGRLRSIARSSPRVVAVSEIGLDFSPAAPDLALQYQAFREQVRLARELQFPIIFHSRELPGHPEGHQEALRVLREERAWEVGGVMHYFQADEAIARACLDLGFLISLAKPLLRLPHLQGLAAALPLETIVLETDSAPQPFKAKRELWIEPRDTRLVAERLATLKGISVEEVAQATTANFLSLYQHGDATQAWGLLSAAVRGGA